MYYLILTGGAFANMLQTVFIKSYDKRMKKSNNFIFTLFVGIAVMTFYLAINGFRYEFDLFTALCGLAFGVSYLTCMVFNVMALTTGPVTFASLFVNFAMLIPIGVGILAYGEYPKLLFYIGMVLLLAALVILKLSGGNAKGGARMTPKWMLCTFVAFLTNGICASLQPYHQRQTGGLYKSEFMVTAMAFVIVVCAAALLIGRKRAREREEEDFLTCAKKAGVFAFCSGICNGLVNLTIMICTGKVPQTVIFPILCGGGLIMVILVSAIFYKEKLSRLQWMSVAVCFASFLMIGIGQ